MLAIAMKSPTPWAQKKFNVTDKEFPNNGRPDSINIETQRPNVKPEARYEQK